MVLLLGAALVTPAAASQPVAHHVDETFSDVVCGIPVTIRIEGVQRLHIHDWITSPEAVDSVFFGLVQNHFRFTWTNAAGVTLTEQERLTIKDLEIADHGDGTWTFSYVLNGMPEKLRVDGGVVAKDVGRIAFEDTVYLGDLTTDADNAFISSRITRINGPHPEADSDFQLFCQVFTQALG
jgi:hypothetical protein